MADAGPDHLTRPSLLVRLRDAQDGGAWQTFVQTYAPLIYARCRRGGLQDADAADVAQDALLEVAGALRTFTYQPERGRFRDWLGLIVRRRLARFFGKQRQRNDTFVAPTEADLEEFATGETESGWAEEFQTHLLNVAMDRIRAQFDPTTWQLFEQAWLKDRPATEIATQLQVRVEAVYVAKSRVLKSLREEILMLAEDLPQCVPLD
jgi:RNA polymerase sigma-70 factor (ECF subfamily)